MNTIPGLLDQGDKAYSEQRFGDAISFYNKVLELDSENPVAFHSIGNVYFGTRNILDSITYFERAFSLAPSVEYARSLGKANYFAQRFGDAVISFEYVLSRHPNDESALYNSAGCFSYMGEWSKAATTYSKLVNLAPENLRYKSAFIRSLTDRPVAMEAASVKQAYVKCLQDDKIQCGAAIDTWFHTISESPEFKPTLEKISQANIENCEKYLEDQEVIKTLNDPLLYHGIEQLIYPADILENTFKAVRCAILNNPKLSVPLVPFIRAMATQMFLTEYAIFETDQETQKVDELLEVLNNGKASALNTQDLLRLACYRQLHLVKPLYENGSLFSGDEIIGSLIKLEVQNHLTEQSLKSTIPAFGSITNVVSQATRSQYEENPCPRWKTVTGLPQPEFLLERAKGLDVLNAGCGTGQEVINAAQVLKTSNFTAIDLSVSSLAYGKRQASEADVQNIDFRHGDILEVGALDNQYDIILSSGVLHHMEDTQEGLNKLASVLKPTGSRMLIALYSKIAREHLFKDIWAYIEDKGYKANDNDIRQFRQDVLNSEPNHFLRHAQKFIDFTSISECRDMLFHVQELRHTWLDIEKMIDEAGLKLINLLVRPDVKQRYVNSYPGDPAATNLKNWHEFELKNPETFKNMYYVWLAHKNDDETAETSPAIWATNYI
ncbi:methyltransferase domain-containing protein [Hellea sp.]|nr:methyltransferase domain-containing protein [Hellea sp.]